jgi:GT2 family glycosyltransferase
MNISILVALKNNLNYTKHFYKTTRDLYPTIEICFSSYGSTDGTHEWLKEIQTKDENIKTFYSDEKNKSFGETYNKAAELATKEYILFAHNDMVLCSKFIENIARHADPNKIVTYTTIEHPIFDFHKRPGKLIYDCGDNLESFDKAKLDSYVDENLAAFEDETEEGISFFMCLPKTVFLSIGGFDPVFYPFFREDDDLIRRLKSLNKIYYTICDALCYHFVSKTSRFSEEYKDATKIIEYNNIKNYIRKWGSLHNENKYNIAIILENATMQTMEAFEPFAQSIYVDNQNIIDSYIDSEQKNTKINLTNRIFHVHDYPIDFDGVVCRLDCSNITQQDVTALQNIPNLIEHINNTGTYYQNNIKITIKNNKPLNQKSLIYV